MANENRMITIGEAAKYLGISRDTLRRWEKRGRLKTFRSPTNRRYFTKELLDEAMSNKQTKSAKEAVSTSKSVKPGRKLKIGKTTQLIVFGVISFILTIIFALFLLYFLLK